MKKVLLIGALIALFSFSAFGQFTPPYDAIRKTGDQSMEGDLTVTKAVKAESATFNNAAMTGTATIATMAGAAIGKNVQAFNTNLTAWAALGVTTKQDQSHNLDGWSGIGTSTKQDTSTNLTAWSDIGPAAKQDAGSYQAASTNLTSWADLGPSTKQDASAVLAAWAAIGPTNILGESAATFSNVDGSRTGRMSFVAKNLVGTDLFPYPPNGQVVARVWLTGLAGTFPTTADGVATGVTFAVHGDSGTLLKDHTTIGADYAVMLSGASGQFRVEYVWHGTNAVSNKRIYWECGGYVGYVAATWAELAGE